MTQKLKLSRGNEELVSSGGNALCGHYLMHLADAHLPAKLQPRRSDAISDRYILLTITGMLCNARTDFANVRLYEGDRVFQRAFLGSRSCLRNRHCDNVWTSLPLRARSTVCEASILPYSSSAVSVR